MNISNAFINIYETKEGMCKVSNLDNLSLTQGRTHKQSYCFVTMQIVQKIL